MLFSTEFEELKQAFTQETRRQGQLRRDRLTLAELYNNERKLLSELQTQFDTMYRQPVASKADNNVQCHPSHITKTLPLQRRPDFLVFLRKDAYLTGAKWVTVFGGTATTECGSTSNPL